MTWFLEMFVEPLLRYGFMRDGLLVAIVVGVTSAVLSCLLVVRRQALLGDAIAHAVLLGVALGWMAAGTVGVFWGAMVVGVATGVAISFIERTSRLKLDAAMGVVFTTAFALGLAIISRARPAGIDLFHVLFGNIIGVSRTDVWLTALSGGAVLVVVTVLFRDFLLWSFDADQARVLGVPTGALSYAFTALLSATIVASLQAVGIVLVVAMLVIPGATAYLLTERLASMMRVAAVCGAVAGIGGLYGSYHADVASGPAIVLVAAALFALALGFAPKRGLLVRTLRRQTAARRIAAEDLLKAVAKAHEGGNGAALPLEAVPPPSRQGLKTLVRRRWATLDGDGVRLTEAGRQQAVQMVRTHRLVESYLHEAEGYTLDELHTEADRREHEITEREVDDIDATLGYPSTDPHGHPIPAEPADLGRIAGHSLCDAHGGQSGTVVMVSDDRDDLLRTMMRLGIVPGAALSVERHDGAGTWVRLEGRRLLLAPEVARRVFVVGRSPEQGPAPG